jgi:hypothetical protein
VKVYQVVTSTELDLLREAIGWDEADVRALMYNAMIDALTEKFGCGDEITKYDIERWVSMKEMI